MKSENSRRGKRSRTAGHNFEREIVNDFKKLGFFDAVTARSESKNMDDKGVDIMFVPYNIQCKNSKTNPNYVELLNDLPKDKPGAIFHRKTKKANTKFVTVGDYVILSKEVFYGLIKQV